MLSFMLFTSAAHAMVTAAKAATDAYSTITAPVLLPLRKAKHRPAYGLRNRPSLLRPESESIAIRVT